MEIDVSTLAFVQSILFVTQLVVIAIQYKINKSFYGFQWWVWGSFFMAMGVIFMPFVAIRSLLFLAILANPFLIFGQICIYIAIMRFIGKSVYAFRLAPLYFLFLILYYYFMFQKNSISARTLVVTLFIGLLAETTALRMFLKKDEELKLAKNFTATVFLFFGGVQLWRFYSVLNVPPINGYDEMYIGLLAGFLVPIIASTLWTFGIIVMLNQKLVAENKEKEKEMRQIFNTIPDAVFISRLSDGYITEANEGFASMTGYSMEEVIGATTPDLNIWKEPEDRIRVIEEVKQSGYCENMEYTFRKKDGSYVIGTFSSRSITIYGVIHIVNAIHDITYQKEAEKAIVESEETYRSILNASPDAITITDLSGRIIIVSRAAKILMGYAMDYEPSPEMNIIDFIVEEEQERARSHFRDMFRDCRHKDQEYHGVRKDGTIINLEVNSEFIKDSLGNPKKMVFVTRDISERKLVEKQIKELILELEIERNIARTNSITDVLTGIANRRYFDEVLNKEFYRLKRSGAVLSIIMMDVDFFKKYNDTYGHMAGDECLKKLGELFEHIGSRAPDLVARYGGEEFVAILPETEEEGAYLVAEKIRKGVEDLKIVHSTSDISPYVTISLGVVSRITLDLDSPSVLIELADDALYRAKANGRNRTEIAKTEENYCNNR